MNDDRWTLITPEIFLTALGETLQMLGVALALGSVLGIAIGTVLALTRPGGVLPNRPVNLILGIVVNLIRSLPFIILLVAILPFTRLLVGTSIGVWAAIVPLTVMIAPYIGRLVENSLLEVPQGVIEAARAMGASPFQIVAAVKYLGIFLGQTSSAAIWVAPLAKWKCRTASSQASASYCSRS